MTLEVIAAILVGLAVLAIVLDPLLRNAAPPAQPAIEPEDLEETPKGIALAALREIEFDRETGKLSDEDYAALKAKYSEEALALLRAEENAQTSEAAPDRIEAMVEARLRTLRGAGPLACPRCGPRPEADAIFCSNCGDRLGGSGRCSACGAALNPDGRFCESCGAAVAA
ncbi:MAG TPA: zinc ribbon domain-containing protein [Gemmatimonadales bacterium]|nr:zinc ribbon domain-containing protein [Gemmatimonadales bacterium]